MNRLKIVLRGLFRKDEAESQFNAELMAYIDHAIDDKIAGGMAPEEARRAALIESGGVEQVKESVRSSRPAACRGADAGRRRSGRWRARCRRCSPRCSTAARPR